MEKTLIPAVAFFLFVTAFILLENELKFYRHIQSEDNNMNEFHTYLVKFNKSYKEDEHLERFKNFKRSVEEIQRLNELHNSVVFGHTKFSDWSEKEFENVMLLPDYQGCVEMYGSECPPKPFSSSKNGFNGSFSDYLSNLPDKIDWRDKHVVGEVINQKLCHGCWAISVVGVMETMGAIDGKGLQELSIQELIDCGTSGDCHRGDPAKALEFLCNNNYPIVEAEQYPLMLIDEPCRMPTALPEGRRIAKFTNRCNVDERVILELIAKHGPVIVVVNASNWRYYINGVIHTACSGVWNQLNHVVQIVGYDLTGTIPFYTVRNSWGKYFGIDGYLRLAIGGNICGLASSVASLDVI